MNTAHLNEHDANQGAQSAGEFLGMTGNSGWYLLGSGGATVLMVVFLWGILGVPLLLCLLAGAILCGLSLTYVFTLKNNRPDHFDTDFFETAVVESGIVDFRFGPRTRRPANPFFGLHQDGGAVNGPIRSRGTFAARRPATVKGQAAAAATPATAVPVGGQSTPAKAPETVSRKDYEELEEKLRTAEESLEDALAEHPED